jgi:lysozyme
MSKVKIVGTGFAFLLLILGGFEGYRTIAYRDIVGIWTICAGHTEGVKPGDRATMEECRALLSEEAREYWDEIDRLVIPPMKPREHIAFTSLAYNIGMDAFARSTLLRYANAGNMPAACLEILKWVYAKGKRINGLMKRRQAEFDICIGATVE